MPTVPVCSPAWHDLHRLRASVWGHGDRPEDFPLRPLWVGNEVLPAEHLRSHEGRPQDEPGGIRVKRRHGQVGLFSK